MTGFLLDTNTCVEVIRRRSVAVMARFRGFPAGELGLSVITLCELEFGAAKSADPLKNKSLLLNFCAPLRIFPFESASAVPYGPLRAHLERAGTSIGPLDMLIASHALSLNLTLVTANEREFRRVPGLKVENWTRR